MKEAVRIVASILLFAATAVFMEFMDWTTHKYIMHGFLWVLHRDHHRPASHGLQRNDLFALFFAAISITLILVGLNRGWTPLYASGFGMALYGMGYIAFHDLLFHRRIRAISYHPRSTYMKRIFRAHRAHHRNPRKHGGTSFSFLYAPKTDGPRQP